MDRLANLVNFAHRTDSGIAHDQLSRHGLLDSGCSSSIRSGKLLACPIIRGDRSCRPLPSNLCAFVGQRGRCHGCGVLLRIALLGELRCDFLADLLGCDDRSPRPVRTIRFLRVEVVSGSGQRRHKVQGRLLLPHWSLVLGHLDIWPNGPLRRFSGGGCGIEQLVAFVETAGLAIDG